MSITIPQIIKYAVLDHCEAAIVARQEEILEIWRVYEKVSHDGQQPTLPAAVLPAAHTDTLLSNADLSARFKSLATVHQRLQSVDWMVPCGIVTAAVGLPFLCCQVYLIAIIAASILLINIVTVVVADQVKERTFKKILPQIAEQHVAKTKECLAEMLCQWTARWKPQVAGISLKSLRELSALRVIFYFKILEDPTEAFKTSKDTFDSFARNVNHAIPYLSLFPPQNPEPWNADTFNGHLQKSITDLRAKICIRDLKRT
jgi:hypothetical protein